MAPSRSSQAQRRVAQSQTEHVYELGKVGRKTGITLPDNGIRDEYGMEDPNIFSSPEKEPNGTNGRGRDTPEVEDEDEQDMELDDGSEMGPATTRKLQERPSRPSLPRARSPIKTNLHSPARHNPLLAHTSSPSRGSIVEAPGHNLAKPVKGKLDFSKSDKSQKKPVANGRPKANGVASANAKLTNGRAHHSEGDDDEDDDEAVLPGRRNQREEEQGEEEGYEESMQVLDMGGDGVDLPGHDEMTPEPDEEVTNEQVEEEEEEKAQPQPAKRRGRKPNQPPVEAEQPQPPAREVDDEPVKKKRGRPARTAPQEEPQVSSSPKRRRAGRNSLSNVEEEPAEEEPVEEREPKRQRTEKPSNKATSAASKAKPAPEAKPEARQAAQKGKPGRKRKPSGVGVASPAVQRGPPLPKARGLVSLRREGADEIRTTRSGRLSVRPLEFWKGERYEFDDEQEEVYGDKRSHFVFNKVKGVVRAEEPEPQPKAKRSRPGKRSSRPRGRRSIAEDSDEEPDDWENDPGRIVGECIYWYPEYEANPPEDEDRVEVVEEELAISSNAINLKDIKDATFKFAKTLTLPFFGAGVVDLPPGSEKRPKNSRKMQMVFFVYTGSVTVTIAEATTFRISKGGMWFVPRGNHYEIKNEGNKTARLFFAQGCELLVQAENQES
ncbi:hypothetical protein DL766_000782 [Monosporascus sp. MC13-8B]|uniref:Mif2/CENP-C cupin domain-containing protein n=1 Tax=Monosporascus cannonballus TaxID=155416 RepID=A0ABY0HH96_9PEZI|nr:hypothetical protein DL762_001091 [Monosporascus cannonballus]RYO98822.1 hypothetical protein DL763_001865 [Monosporascus cannonballus]RYP38782.1 hypothetical protein DL766_000782 [Monosporascus sp. MC13-8B]